VEVQREKPIVVQVGNTADGKPVLEQTAETGNVDKIRDILFGNQLRDYEQKFSLLEDRLMSEIGLLREESVKRFDALEGYIHREVESLNARLQTEKSERAEAVKDLAEELTRKTGLLVKKLGDLDNQLGSSNRDLRRQILDQSRMLSEDIGRRCEETRDSLNRTAGELRAEKVDRSALSGLLTELARRLSEDSPPQVDLEKETDNLG